MPNTLSISGQVSFPGPDGLRVTICPGPDCSIQVSLPKHHWLNGRPISCQTIHPIPWDLNPFFRMFATHSGDPCARAVRERERELSIVQCIAVLSS